MFALILQSVGMGTFNPPNYSSILSVVDEARFGVIGGFINLIRNSANVTGTAIVTVIIILYYKFVIIIPIVQSTNK